MPEAGTFKYVLGGLSDFLPTTTLCNLKRKTKQKKEICPQTLLQVVEPGTDTWIKISRKAVNVFRKRIRIPLFVYNHVCLHFMFCVLSHKHPL